MLKCDFQNFFSGSSVLEVTFQTLGSSVKKKLEVTFQILEVTFQILEVTF